MLIKLYKVNNDIEYGFGLSLFNFIYIGLFVSGTPTVIHMICSISIISLYLKTQIGGNNEKHNN